LFIHVLHEQEEPAETERGLILRVFVDGIIPLHGIQEIP
jgi:hypothetical protein